MSTKPKKETVQQSDTSRDRSTQQQSGTTEATRGPWDAAAGFFPGLFQRGQEAVNLTSNKPFGGDFIAGASPLERSAVDQIVAQAPGLSTGAPELRGIGERIAGGEFLDPNNAQLQAAISAVTNPVQTRLMNEIIPQVTDAAVRGGAYGGTADTLLKNRAIDDFSRGASDIGATMTQDFLNQRWGDVFRAPELLAGANNLALAPGITTGQAGEMERGFEQLGIDNELARYKNEMEAPWYGLQDFANLLTTGGFGTQTGTTEQTGTTQTRGTSNKTGVMTGAEPDLMTQILQGGLGGLSTLASLQGAFPQTMGGFGSILSGLAFSERELKSHIQRLYDIEPGLGVYAFRYKTMPHTVFIGCMVDEAEEVRPDVVFEMDGRKGIDYTRL